MATSGISKELEKSSNFPLRYRNNVDPGCRTHRLPWASASSPRTEVIELLFVLICENNRKFDPSNRTRPFCVPIHRYPSGVCAITLIEPPGNPLSLPHSSWRYCDRGLGVPSAEHATERQSNTRTANNSRNERRYEGGLRNVFKPLNNDLSLSSQRNAGASVDVKIHMNTFASGSWDSGSKRVFRNKTPLCFAILLDRSE